MVLAEVLCPGVSSPGFLTPVPAVPGATVPSVVPGTPGVVSAPRVAAGGRLVPGLGCATSRLPAVPAAPRHVRGTCRHRNSAPLHNGAACRAGLAARKQKSLAGDLS